MEYEAGNYEHYCCRDRLRVVHTPQEHDLMMQDPSLDIIVPELLKAMGISGTGNAGTDPGKGEPCR